MTTKFRMRHGLHWRGSNPTPRDFPEACKNAKRFAIIFICFALASSIDYAVQKDQEAERAAARAADAERMTIDCMNGRARWLYDNGTGVGYGKTLVTCTGVEELNL